MSYDITLFIPKPGKTIEESFDPEEEERKFLEKMYASDDEPIEFNVSSGANFAEIYFEKFMLNEDDKLWITKLVDLIVKDDGEFEIFESNTHVELNHPTGIQISFFSKEKISVSVPYWYEGKEARKIYSKLFAVCHLLNQNGGYCGYDSQFERYYDFKDRKVPKDIFSSNDSVKAKLKRLFGK